jgi:hypothetical protein
VAHTIDIPANSTYTYSRSVTVPPGPPGSHYILVRGDALAAVTELEEGNNTTAVTLVVTGPSRRPAPHRTRLDR